MNASDPLHGLDPKNLLEGALVSEDDPHEREEEARIRARVEAELPDLEVVALLGRGGMGFVYEVRQRKLGRVAALKVLAPRFAKKADLAGRFEREARALARLSHPSIVSVYDYGTEGDLCWLLLEKVEGVNLRQLLEGGELTPELALSIVPALCDALQYAHEHGVVHRDVKPENILVGRDGVVKIADFGLAKLLGTEVAVVGLTGSQQVLGTLRYMAPEQLDRPLEVDHRADIYSLGVVFYEMLTGEIPMGRFAPPSARSKVDPRLDAVVLRALEREPARRYQHASEVKQGVESYSERPADRGGRTPSRLALVSGALVAVGLAVFALMFLVAAQRERAQLQELEVESRAIQARLDRLRQRKRLEPGSEAYEWQQKVEILERQLTTVTERNKSHEVLRRRLEDAYAELAYHLEAAPDDPEVQLAKVELEALVARRLELRVSSELLVLAPLGFLVLCLAVACVTGWIALAGIRRAWPRLYGVHAAMLGAWTLPLGALASVSFGLSLFVLRRVVTHGTMAGSLSPRWILGLGLAHLACAGAFLVYWRGRYLAGCRAAA